MKLVVLILTVTFMQVHATAYSQRMTLSVKNVPVKSIFEAVEKQTGFLTFYNQDLIKDAGPVSIIVKDMPLSAFLDLVLPQENISYIIEGKTIYLSPKQLNAVAEQTGPAPIPRVDITGTIKTPDGKPLAGASVRVAGIGGTYAANDGSFKIGGVADGFVLQFYFVGYQPMSVYVRRDGDHFEILPLDAGQSKQLVITNGTSINLAITLFPALSNLNEVVINKGYYTESQRLSTGSVASIDAKVIEKQPITNVLQALQGRVPGLDIVQNNGFPGSSFSVQVRGVNSMLLNSQPLFVVDGVPFLSTPINAQTGTEVYGANGSTSPLNSISPSDIERIEVLKDGDATAIYGSRGANGVVLITTKHGRPGKTALDINVTTGIAEVPHMLPTLKTDEYLALRKEAFVNSNRTPTDYTGPDLTLWDQHAYTDFQKLLIGNQAKTTEANATISGGDTRTNFLLSGTYHHETTVYYMDKFYNRGSVNFNLNHKSLDQKLSLSFSATYLADNNTLAVQDLTSIAYQIDPNFPLHNPDGSLYFSTFITNPIGIMMRTNRNKTSNLNSSLNLKYQLAPGLDFKVLGGFGRVDMNSTQLIPLASQDVSTGYASSRAIFAYNYSNNYIAEPQLNYQKHFGKSQFSALVGGSWQYRKSRQPYYTLASDFPSDDFLENVTSAATVSTYSSSSDYKFVSVLGRLNYVYDDKYIINGIFRRDGSSRFGPSHRFGNFGSIGAAWIFSDERFADGLHSWLSSGKLRGSYGVTGSDNIGDYQYLDSYSATTYNFNGFNGLVPSRIANGDYRWEQTNKAEIALELGFLKDRIHFTPAYYNNQTGNQLISYAISAQAGFSSYQANMPAKVQNSGWEFTLNTTNIQTKDFNWSSNFNISFNSNKLKSFPGLAQSSYYSRYIVGKPTSGFFTYKYTGHDATTGLPTVADLNKSGSITYGLSEHGLGDLYYYGSAYPKYTGGFSNTFTYKHFTLDVMLHFVKKTATNLVASTLYPPGYEYNISKDALNFYLAQAGGDRRSILARYNAQIGNYFGSDAMMEDASFIRLKNLAIAYELPVNIARTIHLNSARVYLQGQNLFTITKYKGYDPETAGLSLPPLRTLTAGVKLSL